MQCLVRQPNIHFCMIKDFRELYTSAWMRALALDNWGRPLLRLSTPWWFGNLFGE
jgi:hypothetical protein